MQLTAVPACLLLWGTGILIPQADSFLPLDWSTPEMTQLFQDFMIRFNKTYQNKEERDYRFKVFMQNLKASQELQASELGTAQYGVTCFSDLTDQEFKKMSGAFHPSPPILPPTLKQMHRQFSEKPAKSCDWRKFGAITAVKDQGKTCHACWAFSAVSNIEALWNIHQHSPRNLSVQELVDCTYDDNSGCKGGFVWDGLLTVINSSGLSSSKLYPYAGKKQACQKHRKRQLTTIQGYELLCRDEAYIAQVVASQGPVTALINKEALQNYKGGIIQTPPPNCSCNHLDHAVLIVGYGTTKSRRRSRVLPYWIIQNSWGEKWGEKGYFRIHRGSNTCGIAMYPVTATVTNTRRSRCPP
uniref:Cathepsin W n=1 Tax=Salvator merianae TaxID=96440 RepID=A0A8D0E473_SALMN